ncbi:UvrB/UvrC motif-containing protein [Bacteroides sp. BFG-606]|uniref:UvrB/UvrC motif-containing protein n=1 Tax=Bacteroides sp. BFG-606 TaxID=2972763 RepID=UPI0021659A41|nr:UvrB/UvrC motif-containing protein [Bacteroides sp. BFG-606]MCS2335470.1 UvrB/UvrC motif-containing protein [Bacteroides sp. BFG-606]
MPTSEVLDLIIIIALFILNATTVAIIVILISKWHKRMEDKLNDIKSYIHHVTDRNDIVYINQLESLKKELIKAERYEDAEKIRKCIEDEYSNLKEKIENRE